MAILEQIFEIIIIPLVGALVAYAISFIKAKTNELKEKTDNEIEQKYIDKISNTVITCVTATNQTYVDSLKEQGKFDIEAQKIAFQKTYDAILSILDDEIQNYITETSGDLSIYLTQKIEAVVNENK